MWQLADIWPEGAGAKTDGSTADVLVDGMHEFFAIGPVANRPANMVGVSVSFEANSGLVELNIAPGFAAKAWIANVKDYNGGVANVFDGTPDIGTPVYIDDSAQLADGCNLSLAQHNDLGQGNPFAGFLFYDQDDYADYHVGGPNASSDWPKVTDPTQIDYFFASVILGFGCVCGTPQYPSASPSPTPSPSASLSPSASKSPSASASASPSPSQ
jgi:hypothetical protein